MVSCNRDSTSLPHYNSQTVRPSVCLSVRLCQVDRIPSCTFGALTGTNRRTLLPRCAPRYTFFLTLLGEGEKSKLVKTHMEHRHMSELCVWTMGVQVLIMYTNKKRCTAVWDSCVQCGHGARTPQSVHLSWITTIFTQTTPTPPHWNTLVWSRQRHTGFPSLPASTIPSLSLSLSLFPWIPLPSPVL